MSAASGLNAFCWCWLSRPESDRALYRLIRKQHPRKILLLGLGDIRRPTRTISLARRYQPAEQIHFAGIDLFDSRPSSFPRLSLKEAHVLLRPTGARVHLLPGHPHEALPRAANTLHGYELVLIAADQNPESLSRAWFFLNRLLTPEATVLREEIAEKAHVLKQISRAELIRWAASGTPHRRAA